MPLHYTKEVRKTRRKYLKVSFVKFKLLHPFTSCIEEFECIPEVWVPPCPKPKKDKISCNFCLWLQSYIFMSIFLLRKPIIVLFIYWGKPLVQVTVYITIARKRILSKPQPDHKSPIGIYVNMTLQPPPTQTQCQKYLSCYWPNFNETLNVGSWEQMR